MTGMYCRDSRVMMLVAWKTLSGWRLPSRTTSTEGTSNWPGGTPGKEHLQGVSGLRFSVEDLEGDVLPVSVCDGTRDDDAANLDIFAINFGASFVDFANVQEGLSDVEGYEGDNGGEGDKEDDTPGDGLLARGEPRGVGLDGGIGSGVGDHWSIFLMGGAALADLLDFLPHPSHASINPVGEAHEYGPPYGKPGE